jgi:hypothetical protein
MNYYWAQFEKRNGYTFRFDTRIYLQQIDNPSRNDVCIGAVIGKNPGSAQPTSRSNTSLQPIQLGNDKLLPTTRNIIVKAYKNAGKEINNGPNKYIQILNLFYLCNQLLDEARNEIKKFLPNHPICGTESNKFNFVLYSWGGPNAGLNEYKKRFVNNVLTANHIWFEYNSGETKKTLPCEVDSVKHIQGLSHELIVSHIAKIL